MTRYAVRALCHRPTTERIQFIIKNDVHYDMCAQMQLAVCASILFARYFITSSASSASSVGSSHFTRCMKNIALIRMEREMKKNFARCMRNLNCIRLAVTPFFVHCHSSLSTWLWLRLSHFMFAFFFSPIIFSNSVYSGQCVGHKHPNNTPSNLDERKKNGKSVWITKKCKWML